MYRDEILAIGEAVREAHKAGVEETRREVSQYISSLEKAVRVLSEMAKAVQNLKTFPEETYTNPNETTDVNMLRALLRESDNRCGKNMHELHNLKLAASKALNDSGVRYLRRADYWNDVPF